MWAVSNLSLKLLDAVGDCRPDGGDERVDSKDRNND